MLVCESEPKSKECRTREFEKKNYSYLVVVVHTFNRIKTSMTELGALCFRSSRFYIFECYSYTYKIPIFVATRSINRVPLRSSSYVHTPVIFIQPQRPVLFSKHLRIIFTINTTPFVYIYSSCHRNKIFSRYCNLITLHVRITLAIPYEDVKN